VPNQRTSRYVGAGWLGVCLLGNQCSLCAASRAEPGGVTACTAAPARPPALLLLGVRLAHPAASETIAHNEFLPVVDHPSTPPHSPPLHTSLSLGLCVLCVCLRVCLCADDLFYCRRSCERNCSLACARLPTQNVGNDECCLQVVNALVSSVASVLICTVLRRIYT